MYEYGLAFAHNELEEEDIAYFNHEFLQSMGISIAKHRLEILKLARREKSSSSHTLKHPISKFLLVLKKTKKSLANYIATLIHRDDSENRSLIVVPNNKMMRKKKKSKVVGAISYSSRWKKAMMIRNTRKLVMVEGNNQERLMLTNSDYFGDVVGDDPMVVSTPRLDSFSSPLMYDLHQNKEEIKVPDDQDDVDDDHDEHWSPALEEIRWDAMFQDLKPT